MSASNIGLSINGEPAPDDLIDKSLFDSHCKVGQTYKSGVSTSKIIEKAWRLVPSQDAYSVDLITEIAEEPPTSFLLAIKVANDARISAVPSAEVLESLAVGEILERAGTRFRISHIHWWLKPGPDAELHVYGEPVDDSQAAPFEILIDGKPLYRAAGSWGELTRSVQPGDIMKLQTGETIRFVKKTWIEERGDAYRVFLDAEFVH